MEALIMMFFGLLFIVVAVGFAFALYAGVALGAKYLGFLRSRSHLPRWVFPIKLGWFFVALGASTMASFFSSSIALDVGGISILAGLICWLCGLKIYL